MVKTKDKSNLKYPLILLLAMFIVSIFAIGFTIAERNKPLQELKPDYKGLATLGIIPSKIQCSHSYELYDSTNVGIKDREGNIYLILESKFGDESCLYKL
jgi:hypothetical protein